MHFSSLALVSALAHTSLAIPAPATHRVHEKREHVPKAWVKGNEVDGSISLPVRIGMKQSNLDAGHQMLMDVSHPSSDRYGQYYTANEVIDLFAPSESSVDAVKNWLETSGIASDRISQSVNKQWIQFDALAEELGSLLHTKYHVYEHQQSGKSSVATEEYHVPSHIQEHVDYVTPGIKLFTVDGSKYTPKPKTEALKERSLNLKKRGFKLPPLLKDLEDWILNFLKRAKGIPEFDLALCDLAITPPCIARMYNITPGDKANETNKMGIFESIGDTYSQTDLNEFFGLFAQNIPQGTGPELEPVDGAMNAPAPTILQAGPESDLDFEISYPILFPQGTILFQTDDDNYQSNYTFDGFFNDFLDAIDGSYCSYSAFGETGNDPTLDPTYPDPAPAPAGYKGSLQCGIYQPTNVISVSYGGQEPDLPAYYQQRQCNEFMKLGMQGVSIVFASGDSGVGGRAGDDSADGCLGPNGAIFSPDFPATCPYLTTVGATYLPEGADVNIDAEVAVTRFGSGGGFSNIYPIPDYQKDAVATFFNDHNPPYAYYSSTNNDSFGANGGVYNRIGRGYPDVSAVGDNVVVVTMSTPTLIGGTSAAAPVFAAILNRINEERIAAGKGTVGFVNPVLYQNPQVLHDITEGDNPGCNTNGFNATTGWDPVTGLGTPNYPAMLELFMGMP